jgi:hypothetical protein
MSWTMMPAFCSSDPSRCKDIEQHPMRLLIISADGAKLLQH